jgi:hypothetical protein
MPWMESDQPGTVFFGAADKDLISSLSPSDDGLSQETLDLLNEQLPVADERDSIGISIEDAEFALEALTLAAIRELGDESIISAYEGAFENAG